MNDFYEKEDDPLESLLGPLTPTAGNDALRHALLVRTIRLLRLRSRMRRLAWVAALAACYAAGMLTMHWSHLPGPVPVLPEVVQRPEAPPTVMEAQAPLKQTTALALELAAVESKGPQERELFRQAAERYLSDEDDVRSAVRCYGNSLSAGTQADLAITPEDCWLLMVIKDARQMEKRHAKKDG